MEEYIQNIDLQTVSMQTLAFIGDAVYNVYIRCYLASNSNQKTNKLHNSSIRFVSARAQAKTIDKLIENLNENEISVYKRGRNTNINSVSKNADIVEYKKATGFEALIGYLYVNNEKQRLEEIVKLCIKYINEMEETTRGEFNGRK